LRNYFAEWMVPEKCIEKKLNKIVNLKFKNGSVGFTTNIDLTTKDSGSWNLHS